MSGIVALFISLTVMLAGCSKAPSHVHELRLAMALDPVSLSPVYAFAQDQIALDLYWCQTLVGLDAQNRLVPILVTRVPSRENGDIAADGRSITYHLRDDVKFADGVPFTADDVVFTYHALLDPANNASASDYRMRIDDIRATDAHTVVVRLKRPWSAAVRTIFAHADFAYGILPKHAFATTKVVGTGWDDHAFGTGPFRVATWKRGDHLELEPNPNFVPAPRLARITIRIVPNQTTAFEALQTGEVDAAEINADNADAVAKMPAMRVVRTPENGLVGLYFQSAAAPTSDVAIRRAVSHALDRAQLRPAWHGLFPDQVSIYPGPVASWPQPIALPHDVARARAELDAAGWRLQGRVRVKDGKRLTFSIVTDSGRPIYGRIAIIVQSQLAALGADVTIKSLPTSLMTAPDGPERSGRFGLLIDNYIGGGDPSQSLNLRCADARGGGGNYARWCDPAFEALDARQAITPDGPERTNVLRGIESLVQERVPVLPLYEDDYLQGVAARVDGYARNMLRYPVAPETWDTR